MKGLNIPLRKCKIPVFLLVAHFVILPSDSLCDVTSLFSASGKTVLLTEDFNDQALKPRGWYDAGAESSNIVNDPQRGAVLEYSYTQGSSTPSTGALRHLFNESEQVTVSYYIKYSGNWEWTNKNYGPHEFYLLTNLDHAHKGPAQSHTTTYLEFINGIGTIGFQDALNIDQDQIDVQLLNITENRGVFGCNGSSDAYPDGICWGSSGEKINGKKWLANMPKLNNNQWYKVEVNLSMNSTKNGKGLADGQISMKIDSMTVLNKSDIMIRTGQNATMQWNQILIGPYFHDGVAQAQKFWIDDLTITESAEVSIDAPDNLEITSEMELLKPQ